MQITIFDTLFFAIYAKIVQKMVKNASNLLIFLNSLWPLDGGMIIRLSVNCVISPQPKKIAE